MSQHAPSVDAKQQLDLIDPTGVQRREVEDESLLVPDVEIVPHGLRTMCVEVIPNDVHRALGVDQRNLLHKGHEIVLRAPICGTADDPSRMHIHRRNERLRAVADVLELAAPCTTRSRRAIRVLALDGLDPGLLVDRQHDRALGGSAIQRADLIDLLPELRVGAMQPLPNTVRPQVARLQDALQMAAADLLDHTSLDSAINQFVQRGRSPPLQLSGLASQRQQLQALRLADAPRTTRTRDLLQTLDASLSQPTTPMRNRLHRDTERLRDRCRRLAPMSHQRDLRTHHLPLLRRSSAGQQLKRLALFSR